MPKMGPMDYELDAVKLMQQMTIKVKVVREREMRFRIWLATRFILLAGLVTGMGIEIKDMEDQNDT